MYSTSAHIELKYFQRVLYLWVIIFIVCSVPLYFHSIEGNMVLMVWKGIHNVCLKNKLSFILLLTFLLFVSTTFFR